MTSPTEPARPNARIDAAAKWFWIERNGEYDAYRWDNGTGPGGLPESTRDTYRDAARKVLAAADAVESSDAEKLREALREAEWAEVFSYYDMGDFICGACGNTRAHGHGEGCSVADALALAESVSSPETHK